MKKMPLVLTLTFRFAGLFAILFLVSCSAPRSAYLSNPAVGAVDQPVPDEAQAAGSISREVDLFASTDDAVSAELATDEVSALVQALAAKDQKSANRLSGAVAKAEISRNEATDQSAKKPTLVNLAAKKLTRKVEKVKNTLESKNRIGHTTKAAKAINNLITIGAIIALVGVLLFLLTGETNAATILIIVGAVLLLVGILQ
jgi:hypothetical protein